MKFQCLTSDGPAQTGILCINESKVLTPTIFYVASERYHPPTYADCFIKTIEPSYEKNPCIQVGPSIFFTIPQSKASHQCMIKDHIIIPESLPTSFQTCIYQQDSQKHNHITVLPSNEEIIKKKDFSKHASLFIVSNASQLFNNAKKLVSYLTTLRSSIHYDSLIYIPTVANPSTIALLTYLGCDLFDATGAILAARHQQFFLPHTVTKIHDLYENPCPCPICSQTTALPKEFSYNQILQHNYFMLHQELLNIRNAINNHLLRDLVEQRIRVNPHLITILRYLDNLKSEYLEQRSPVSMPTSYTLKVTSREAGFRPEIIRFQKRLLTRYQKPAAKKILLLLPCSAKKPYSFSKSHQRFYQSISKVPNHSIIHEVIVTSPLGLVPRELELTFPASSYDISVTGTWFEDEKQMIQTQLETFLQQNNYDAIVSHLPEDLVYPPKDKKDIWKNSLNNEPATSKKALQRLTKILNELMAVKSYKNISKSEQKIQQVNAIATYQFGNRLSSGLLKQCVISGKYPYLKIFDEHHQQIGMIPDQRGLISLTAEGGKRISHFNKYIVSIETGFTVKGSILAPGIISCDPDIRRGDDVIVIQGDSYLGVGLANMNGSEMMSRSYGEAVNMRHKIKTKK